MKTGKEKYLEAKKKGIRNVYHPKYEAKSKRCGNLWYVRVIRNVICLRFQKGWSKLIRILLQSSTQEMIMAYL